MMRAVRSLSQNRRDLISALSTMLVGGVLVATGVRILPPPPCTHAQIAAQYAGSDEAGAVQVQVLSSTNKSAILAEMACTFERGSPTVDGRPLDVTITAEPSGSAYRKLGDGPGQIPATVWSPAASSWVEMLRQDHEDWVPADPLSIASSPQVIAMPEPIATALGWPDETLGWKTIARYATHPSAWNKVADPSWGGFKLGKTNPTLSTSGLNSTVATFKAATGQASDLTTQQIDDPKALSFVRDVESAAVHYAPTSVDFLRNLRAQDDQGLGERYVSAILLEEKSVWDYNHGNPTGDPETLGSGSPPSTKLVAFYPKEGALVADHPYVILQSDWVSEQQRVGAQRFLDFLIAPEQQERFQSLGFRDRDDKPGSEINPDNGLLPNEPAFTLTPPSGVVLKSILENWPDYRKRARTLILMDVSGSMDATLPGTDRSLLDLAKSAALDAIDRFGANDEVGLWAFSPASADGPYRKLVPIGQLAHNEGELRAAIAGLSAEPGNGTELYSTIEAAAAQMYRTLSRSKINGIILLSDGTNEGANNDRGTAIAAVTPSGPDDPVRVFTIAYGPQADRATLAALASASYGTSYDASDPSTIEKVFSDVVANF
jgi:Ca-activated chloride channel family protein